MDTILEVKNLRKTCQQIGRMCRTTEMDPYL